MNRLPIALLALAAAAACCAYAGAFDRGHATATEPAAEPAAATPAEPGPGFAALFGDDLLNDKGEAADVSELDGKTIALYFSASWCPPCRAFTPRLVDLAKKLQSDGKPFAIVLVGCDQDRQKALAYMSSHNMTGYLIPPEAASNRTLSKRYRVSGIPYLAILGPDGATIDPSGRATVQSSPGTAWQKWSR